MKHNATGMTPTEIRIEMLKKEVSLVSVARACGVTTTSVYRVIEGTIVSDRVRRALADAIGIDIRRIWPDPYLYGSPRKAGRPHTGTTSDRRVA